MSKKEIVKRYILFVISLFFCSIGGGIYKTCRIGRITYFFSR